MYYLRQHDNSSHLSETYFIDICDCIISHPILNVFQLMSLSLYDYWGYLIENQEYVEQTCKIIENVCSNIIIFFKDIVPHIYNLNQKKCTDNKLYVLDASFSPKDTTKTQIKGQKNRNGTFQKG
ncbi:hypothetical protein A3Q56_06365 [Intoshia linei]|uniref:Uncharacterized protein n=1 Tax=Intoshia linei TaxID=1819745 RepID=A0A177AWX1_9BILA|nr:hypothetical protein A3Q56_06365 [Intoshia linei]